MRVRARAAAWVVAAVLAAAGCDFFRPAEPEPPPEGSIILPDYSFPDSTLATIARSVADKGRTNGGSVYAEAFAESYRQFFALEDSIDWQRASTVPEWTHGLELTFYNRLINLRGDLYRLVWEPDPPHPDDDSRPDVVLIHRRYLLTTMSQDSVQTSVLAVGYADLTLARGSDGNWRIVVWQDRRDPQVNDPDALTLGRWRLNLAGA